MVDLICAMCYNPDSGMVNTPFHNNALKRKKMIMETNTRDNRSAALFSNGRIPSIRGNTHMDMEWVAIVREITSRLAIYRKLKELGHSDESIFTIYKKSNKEHQSLT